MAKRKNSPKSIYTSDYISNSMTKENSFIIVGMLQSKAEVNEVTRIVKVAQVGLRFQNLKTTTLKNNKEV